MNGEKGGNVYAILGAVACALGAIMYGLAFTPVAIYGLIAGIVCEIAACGLFRAQQKRRPMLWAKVVLIISYVLLALGAAFMVGGIIWAALQQSKIATGGAAAGIAAAP